MSQHTAENREPLVHLSKRPAIHPVKGALIRLAAIGHRIQYNAWGDSLAFTKKAKG